MNEVDSLLCNIKQLNLEITLVKLKKLKKELDLSIESTNSVGSTNADNISNETDDRQKYMDDATDTANETLRVNYQNFLKAILTFSSGALGVFFTLLMMFLKNEVKIELSSLSVYIIVASILFLLSIVFIFVSFWVSKNANLKALDNMYIACQSKIDDPNLLPNKWESICNWLEAAILVCVIMGSASMTYVYISLINIKLGN